MTPIEMHYSWIGFVYGAMARLGQFLAEKLFDVALAAAGTWLGYWLARKHLEHYVSGIVAKMDAKYLNLNRQMAFHRAVNAMLPELPQFYLRPSKTFSPQVAGPLAEFTSWSTAIDSTHTEQKSMELVGTEAYTLAEKLVEQDMGFKEEESVPNYDWIIEIGPLSIGWTVEESPDLSIYNWDTGVAVYRHALMKETARTPTSIRSAVLIS